MTEGLVLGTAGTQHTMNVDEENGSMTPAALMFPRHGKRDKPAKVMNSDHLRQLAYIAKR